MKYLAKMAQGGRIFVVRLRPDADLLPALRDIAQKEDLKAGVILSAAGLLRKAHLRNCKSFPKEYPITDANRAFIVLEKPLEILGLSGIIYTVKGIQEIHAHATLSYVEDGEVKVVGGHLLDGCIVFGFAEIVIMELTKIDMEKRFDSETKTLQLFVEE